MTTTTTTCTTQPGASSAAALASAAATGAPPGAKPARSPAAGLDRILLDAVGTFLGASSVRPAPKPAKPTAPKKTTTTSLPKELAFLGDGKMSVQEKIFRLLLYFQEKYDREVEAKLKAYSGKVTTTTTENGGANGDASKVAKKVSVFDQVLGFAKAAMPGLALTQQILQNPLGGKFLQELGGPAFAAAATALGFPELAPLMAQVGPQLVDGLVAATKEFSAESLLRDFAQLGGDAGTAQDAPASTGSAASGTRTTTETTEADEKRLASELSWAMQQQQAMTSMLSNVMKVMHDTNMAVIHNIR